MIKKVFRLVILVLIVIGIVLGIMVTIKKQVPEFSEKEINEKIFGMIQEKEANLTAFYTYGRAFNFKGNITNINKENFESAKIYITDGGLYEKEYDLAYEFDGTTLNFLSNKELNSGLILDDLSNAEYYVFLRLKLNNSADPRFYTFDDKSECKNIDYYTITKDGKNRKADIGFESIKYNEKECDFLKISLTDSNLPDDVYDVVIDAGHGGSDPGETRDGIKEADISLDYAKSLKTVLEEEGYKVKLTRDDENSSMYNYTNMYDTDGRITEACRSKAKLMISFHVNQGDNGLRGLEIYAPCKANLVFAKEMANNIKENSGIEFSNNSSYRRIEGVYIKNFTKNVIVQYADTANKKGYEPYNITTETPYLYTIREVGGIATGAYVDGRNTAYNANQYYDSNQGIECYQVELGYIKNDLEKITNEKDGYIKAIKDAICNHY